MTEKTFLVKMPEPKNCNDCRFFGWHEIYEHICMAHDNGEYTNEEMEVTETQKPTWCPIVPVKQYQPEKFSYDAKKVWVEE